jgi:hypothetical protein
MAPFVSCTALCQSRLYILTRALHIALQGVVPELSSLNATVCGATAISRLDHGGILDVQDSRNKSITKDLLVIILVVEWFHGSTGAEDPIQRIDSFDSSRLIDLASPISRNSAQKSD